MRARLARGLLAVFAGVVMDYDRVGRIANAVLGAWLFLSSFLLRSTIAQQVNMGLVGTVALGAAIAAFYRWPALRYVNAALGVWLVASTWLVDTRFHAVIANNLLVGVLMFGFAFMASDRGKVIRAREV